MSRSQRLAELLVKPGPRLAFAQSFLRLRHPSFPAAFPIPRESVCNSPMSQGWFLAGPLRL
jgi:hypothetical protein